MEEQHVLWSKTRPTEKISANQIHVWKASLNVSELQSKSLLKILSEDEVTRAERFHFEEDRKNFISTRGVLRQILSFYLEMPAPAIQFDYTHKGKPFLLPISNKNKINFNLSYSGEYALFAIAQGRRVGVDLEHIRNDIDPEDITLSLFSLNEIISLEQIDNKLGRVFFQYWARKEALLKATGKGFSFPMDQVDASYQNGKIWSPFTLVNERQEKSYWYIQDLVPGDDYTAAVAIDKDGCDISCWLYTPQ